MDGLIKGIAYHSNRMLESVRGDMQNIASCGFNTVLHTFSHNDWDRHKRIMREIFDMTEYYGLDLWVDAWGLGGPPGDKSHFLSYHPEAHQIKSNGDMNPVYVCFNSEAYVDFIKSWIDTIYELGARKIFWDEPNLTDELIDGVRVWGCRCEKCRKLFEERYNKPMPTVFTDEVDEFRKWSVTNFFRTVAAYAKEKEMYNSICVMFHDNEKNAQNYGVDLDSICSVPELDNIGSDPYWILRGTKGYADVYEYVYGKTAHNLDVCKKYRKDHNIWIQGFRNPTGREEEIIAAADAIYDAGARSIFVWGYRGSDSNDYRAEAPERSWYTTRAAFERISERFRNEQRDEIRRKIKL